MDKNGIKVRAGQMSEVKIKMKYHASAFKKAEEDEPIKLMPASRI